MTTYGLLLFVHVLAAAAWFGAALMSLLLLSRGIRTGDRQWLLRLAEHDDALGPRFYVPASLTTLASGIALVATSGWDLTSDLWTTAGLVLFVIVFLMGVLVFLPAGERLRDAAREHGVDSDQVGAALARLRRASHADVGLLGVAILLMTTKPF